MPALSPTMEKGNLARWLKKEGDKIKSGDVIAEIETDKATMEYEAVDEGTLAKIVVPEGTQDVAVNSVIAVLAGEGEDVKAAASAAKAAPAKAPEKKAEAAPATTKPSPQRGEGAPRDARAETFVRPPAGEKSPPKAAAENPASRSRQSCLFVSTGAPPCEGGRHRSRPCAGLRSARPCNCARYRCREVGQGIARACCRRTARGGHGASHVRPTNSVAL